MIMIMRSGSTDPTIATFVPSPEDGFLHGFDMLQWPINATPLPGKPASVIAVITPSNSKVMLFECLGLGPSQCSNRRYSATITWATPPAHSSLPGVGAKIMIPSHGLEATWTGTRFEDPNGEEVNRVCPTLGTGCP